MEAMVWLEAPVFLIDAHAEERPKAVSVGSQAFAISDAMVRKIATPALKPH